MLACLATVPSVRVAAEVVVEPPQSFIDKLLAEIHAKVDAAIIAQPPKLVPPTPIKVGWKLAKLATVDLGGPLAALTAGDLDGDGKAELYAVTPSEVIALGVDKKGTRILGRIAFSGDRMAAPPRDVVATAIIEGTTVVAAVSGWQRGMRVIWQAGALTATPIEGGFPQCIGEVTPLIPGRNYFGFDVPNAHYGMHCTQTLVDANGYPLRTRARLTLANKLEIAVERCAAAGLGCQPAERHEYAGVGIAWEIADVDRDGKPELVYAGAGAPGDPDALKIVSLGDDDKKQSKLRKAFPAGGVAGIAVGDIDGNGAPDTIAAVRLLGATRVDLWRVE